MDVHTGTISRRMRGVTLPPWRSVTYYAETGSRCPAAPEHDLRDYIGRCYRSRAAKEGLRAALAETLAELPQVDREDVLAYCGDGDLARLWAVLQWHALCCDYADRYSDCVKNSTTFPPRAFGFSPSTAPPGGPIWHISASPTSF